MNTSNNSHSNKRNFTQVSQEGEKMSRLTDYAHPEDVYQPTPKRSRMNMNSMNTFYQNDTMYGNDFDHLEDVPPVQTAFRRSAPYVSNSSQGYNSYEPDMSLYDNTNYADMYSNTDQAYVTPDRYDYERSSGYHNYYGSGGASSSNPYPNDYYYSSRNRSCQTQNYQMPISEPYPSLFSNHQDFNSNIPTVSFTETQPEHEVYDPNRSSDTPVSIYEEQTASAPVASPVVAPKLPKKSPEKRFKTFHNEKWNENLEALREFKKKYGHCLVPHTFPENQHLARWVKRQRRQYKLMKDGNASSTMTPQRVEILNGEGFIWDSHEIVWRERYEQLKDYKREHGHCRVPSYCKENPQLASWVKCQRRQYKLFWEGKRSSMSVERTQMLENVGFTWEVRNELKSKKKNDESYKKLAEVLNGI